MKLRAAAFACCLAALTAAPAFADTMGSPSPSPKASSSSMSGHMMSGHMMGSPKPSAKPSPKASSSSMSGDHMMSGSHSMMTHASPSASPKP